MEAWKLSQQQISNYRIDIDNNIIKKGKTAMATTMGRMLSYFCPLLRPKGILSSHICGANNANNATIFIVGQITPPSLL